MTLPGLGVRTLIMGVVNVTPDSFSGDGIYGNPQRAAALAERQEAEGADIIDVGGESTRPGAVPVSEAEELARIEPALDQIVARVRVPVSIDTRKPEVARRALALGCRMVNDVTGQPDAALLAHVAAAGALLVGVHHRRVEASMPVVEQILAGLGGYVSAAESAGVRRERILVDPGLGMAKGWRENFAVVRELRRFQSLGCPVLVGPSRKGMIGRVLGTDAADRVEGTIALVTLCVAAGASVVRVHDVARVVRATRLLDAVISAQ